MGEAHKPASNAQPSKSVNSTRPDAKAVAQAAVNIVIVEDQSILALELESVLISSGYNEVRIFSDADSCQASIVDDDTISPELAILDINLGSTTSYDLAENLFEQGVQIVFLSGYDEKFGRPELLQSAPRLQKPVDTNELLHLLSQLGIKKS